MTPIDKITFNLNENKNSQTELIKKQSLTQLNDRGKTDTIFDIIQNNFNLLDLKFKAFYKQTYLMQHRTAENFKVVDKSINSINSELDLNNKFNEKIQKEYADVYKETDKLKKDVLVKFDKLD